jgi:hypothetical protein
MLPPTTTSIYIFQLCPFFIFSRLRIFSENHSLKLSQFRKQSSRKHCLYWWAGQMLNNGFLDFWFGVSFTPLNISKIPKTWARIVNFPYFVTSTPNPLEFGQNAHWLSSCLVFGLPINISSLSWSLLLSTTLFFKKQLIVFFGNLSRNGQRPSLAFS